MRQKVTVIRQEGDEVVARFQRPTACHGDCGSCAGGCGAMAAREELIVHARNEIGARPGDQVWIEGETKKVALAIWLVYGLPVVLFFLGYFLGAQLFGSGTLTGVLGFFLGLGLAVLESFWQKRKGKAIRYRAVAFVE